VTDARVRIEDIISAGHCVRGARRWFEQHGLNFRAFIKDGEDPAVLLATGDALAEQVIARKEANNHG
jgi:hypothetical protein